ncbi:MAG: alpha/beta hydrolase [Propioniciclava sp.]|jgi:pimeloyl-ACP methyl ester carboxylesterase
MDAERRALELSWGRVSAWWFPPQGRPRGDVLLLHGGGLDNASLSWGGLAPVLAASGYRVVAPDAPGYGSTPMPPWPVTQDRLVAFVGEVIEAAGLKRPVIGGLSMGGGMALGYALTPGASLRGLIVLGSYGLTGQFISGRGAPLWNRVTSWAIQSGWLGKFERGVARNRALLRWSVDSGSLVRDPARLDAAMREEIAREGASPHAFEAFEQWQRSEVLPEGLRSNYVPRLHEIRVPTLIVHGESDQGVPVEAARAAAAEIPGAELVVVPGGRHWVQRDAPGVVDAAVLGFLARLA